MAAAGVLLFAAALVFTGCSNGSDSGGGTPTPKHAVTFSVDGGNGTLKATVGGTEISSGDTV
ncbi:leucine-rich repeat domain-containing protein, partial [Treponema socranskii]|nr:leucine-rich repeat domain-containing protein [Treponema socranskii]